MQYYSNFGGYLSLVTPAVVLLPRWTNYPMPGLNVVFNLYKLALLPTPSIRHFSRQSSTIKIGLTIGCSDNRLSGQSGKCAISQALVTTHCITLTILAI